VRRAIVVLAAVAAPVALTTAIAVDGGALKAPGATGTGGSVSAREPREDVRPPTGPAAPSSSAGRPSWVAHDMIASQDPFATPVMWGSPASIGGVARRAAATAARPFARAPPAAQTAKSAAAARGGHRGRLAPPLPSGIDGLTLSSG
jgi:hypothetical protein